MTCPHCHGLGFDASGYRCTCQPSTVAKIGRKDHAQAPLPASPWRAYLRDLGRAMLAVILTWLVGALAFAALALTGVIA